MSDCRAGRRVCRGRRLTQSADGGLPARPPEPPGCRYRPVSHRQRGKRLSENVKKIEKGRQRTTVATMRVHLLTALLLAVSVPALGRVAVQDGSDHPPSRRARQAVGGLGCGPGEFRCLDGTCIEDCYTCDTRADCPDGSDETEPHGCAERCGDGRFRCDGRCLDNRQLCDGRADCPSGTDERFCPTTTTTTPRPCTYYEFRCDGRCFDLNRRCDGRWDCSDGSDERGCTTTTTTTTPRPCTYYEFRCDGRCFDLNRRCDGRWDCSDGSDEWGCTTTTTTTTPRPCTYYEFRCDGRCMDNRLRCDGRWDCSDGSDEWGCTTTTTTTTPRPPPPPPPGCRRDEFRCIEDGRCIPYCYRCDGGVECVDGSDEIGCPGQTTTPRPCFYYEFRCDDRCVDNRLRCDGRWDCSDGSDEWGCTTTTTTTPRPPPPPPPPGCRTDQFECLSGEPRCIDSCYACDGRKDCADNSDESEEYGCSRTEQCTTGEYRCDGRCLPVETLCDGVPHCSDGHDERNCIRGVLVA